MVTVSKNDIAYNIDVVTHIMIGLPNENIDNLKFLESMTAIYEKSGRHDLARGLKASLSKNLK